jgi:hypothetical protein
VNLHSPLVQVTPPLHAIQGQIGGAASWSAQFADHASWFASHAVRFMIGPPQQPSAFAHSSALLGAVA